MIGIIFLVCFFGVWCFFKWQIRRCYLPKFPENILIGNRRMGYWIGFIRCCAMVLLRLGWKDAIVARPWSLTLITMPSVWIIFGKTQKPPTPTWTTKIPPFERLPDSVRPHLCQCPFFGFARWHHRLWIHHFLAETWGRLDHDPILWLFWMREHSKTLTFAHHASSKIRFKQMSTVISWKKRGDGCYLANPQEYSPEAANLCWTNWGDVFKNAPSQFPVQMGLWHRWCGNPIRNLAFRLFVYFFGTQEIWFKKSTMAHHLNPHLVPLSRRKYTGWDSSQPNSCQYLKFWFFPFLCYRLQKCNKKVCLIVMGFEA